VRVEKQKMYKNRKISAFDVVAFIVFLALAFIFWSFMRAVSLVQPAEFDFEIIQPVGAAPQERLPDSAEEAEDVLPEFKRQLEMTIAGFVDKQPNDFGVYVSHLETGVSAEHNGQYAMSMASLYKPFAVVEALKMVDAGLLNLAQPLLEDGTTLSACLEKAITVSDNPCGLALLKAANLSSGFGLKKIQTLGYKHTDLRGYFPETTPRDMAKLMENIYRGTGLSADGQQTILSSLLGQTVNDRLPAGLPADSQVAHKTGDLNGYSHDAGLVLDSQAGDYIIVVMSGPDDSGRLLSQRYVDFARLASVIHELMLTYSARL
jgi:beta-lactamase class A